MESPFAVARCVTGRRQRSFVLPKSPPADHLEDLLPDRWLAKNPEHRWQIDELRAEERKRSRQQRIAKRKT